MGVGPQYVVAVVNLHVAFYRKTDGLKTFEQDLTNDGFFSQVGSSANGYSDPKVFFDPVSQRWFLCLIEFDNTAVSKVDIAVSDDANPNGNWFQYGVDVHLSNGGTTYWMDYPTIGCNKDAVMVSGNMFGFSSGYFGAEAVVIPKAPLLTGGSATTSILLEAGGGTLQPCRTSDPTVDKIYGMSRGGGTNLKIFAITNLLNSPVLTITSLAVPAYGIAARDGIPAGGGHQLDALDSRIYNSGFRNGKMVGAHTITQNGGFIARWYQVAVNGWPAAGAPTLVQSGNVNIAGANTHMPAINTNSVGDIAMLYTRSSLSINADLCTSSHKFNDPLGAMGAPVLVQGSPGPYGGGGFNRWGDYFSVAIDPVDNTTFWGFGMIGTPNGNWATVVTSWVVSTSSSSDTVVPATDIQTIYGSQVGGDLSSILAADGSMYSVDSILVDRNYNPPGNGAPLLGHITEVETSFNVVSAGLTSLKVAVKGSAISGVSGMVYAYNYLTDRFDFLQSVSMSSANKLNTVALKANTFSKYVGPAGAVRIRFRAINPVRQGRPTTAPPAFEFGGDQIQLLANNG